MYTICQYGSKKAKKVVRKKRTRSPSSEPTAPQPASAEVEDRPSSNEQPQPHPSDAEDMERDVDRDSSISENEASDEGASSAKATVRLIEGAIAESFYMISICFFRRPCCLAGGQLLKDDTQRGFCTQKTRLVITLNLLLTIRNNTLTCRNLHVND